jgi:hypothetical protein
MKVSLGTILDSDVSLPLLLQSHRIHFVNGDHDSAYDGGACGSPHGDGA